MKGRLAGLIGGGLALAALAAPPAAAWADAIPSPAFQITDLGNTDGKGITGSGMVFGSKLGSAFTAAPIPAPPPPGDPLVKGAPAATNVGNLGGGYSVTQAMNNQNSLVGQYQVTTEQGTSLRPFLQTDGQLKPIPTLGGNSGTALGLNNSGTVVGTSQNAEGADRGFVYQNGQVTDVGSFGGRSSEARVVNDSGQVAGAAQTSDGSWNAFLRTGDTNQNLGTLGGQNSYAYALNGAGQVAGASQNAAGDMRAFLSTAGQMKDLGTLGTSSFALGLNSAGMVVGWNRTGIDDYRAFLFDGQTMHDLNNFLPGGSPFAELNGATGINDAGQIVGWGRLANGEQHTFVLTPLTSQTSPVPEPSTLALFGLIAAAAGVGQHRRRRLRVA